jgi:DNA-binding beta-propeller fold protein YncE
MAFRAILGVMVLAFTGSMSYAQGAQLLVIEKGAQSLAIVDPVAGSVVASVPEGAPAKDTGHEVAASKDGKLAFVPIYGNSGVGRPGTDGRDMVVIDVTSHKVIGRVDFGHGVRPHFPALNPKDGLLYVTTELDKSLTIVDPKTLKIVGQVPTGSAESHMLAMAHDGKRGYTANVGPGTVSVLDLVGRKTIAVIPVAGMVQRISISMNDKMVFTSDQTKPELDVIDTATNTVSKRITMPASGYGSAPTPDGKWLLVALMSLNKVAVIDLKTMIVAKTIDVPATPQEVLVRPDGSSAYVSCDASSSVAEIDLGNWTVKRIIHTGKSADGLAWAK